MPLNPTNPFALALSGGSLPASRSVGRSFERDALTREEQYIAQALRTQVSAIDAWASKAQFATAEVGRMNVFGATAFQHTLRGMSEASRLPGASSALQSLMDQFVEAQAVAAGTQMAQLLTIAANNIFGEFNRPLFPDNLPPEQPGLMRRLLGGG